MTAAGACSRVCSRSECKPHTHPRADLAGNNHVSRHCPVSLVAELRSTPRIALCVLSHPIFNAALRTRRCDKDDDAFVSAVCERRGWVTTDIARVFERPVCIHILKFLDPRSVCRASRVSWAWHALAISDSVWKPHCLQMAWHLPYVPSQLERGAWKTYYTQCVQSWKSAAAAATKAYTKPAVKPQTQDEIEYGLALVVDASDDDNDGQAYGKLPVGHSILRRHDNDQEARRHLLLRQGEAFVAVDGRNSSGSRERGAIEQSQSSLTSNAYHALKELMKSRQLRWESDKARLPRSRSHVTMQGGADHTKLPPFMPHASGSSDRPHVAHVAQRRPGTAASPPVARGAAPAPALELEGDDLHPRIIFISSAMPARAVLLDAVRYDVVAIPYEAGGGWTCCWVDCRWLGGDFDFRRTFDHTPCTLCNACS